MLSDLVKEKITGLIGFVNKAKITEVEKSWEEYFEQFKIVDEQEQVKEFNNIIEQRIINFKFKKG